MRLRQDSQGATWGRRKEPRRLDRRRFVVRAVAGGLTLGLGAGAACGGNAEPADSSGTSVAPGASGKSPSGEIVMALVTLADQSTDPHVTRVANLAPITTSCFEQFQRWDEGGKLVPALASRMEESPDHLQLVFTLRPDATFWDGSPVTAGDAVWSFERYISVQPGDTYQKTLDEQVESVSAGDEHTVIVKLSRPSTLRLSFGIINPRGWNIASRAHYERAGEDEFRRAPMCTGPFRLVRSEPQQFVELAAYEGHYERVPSAAKVRLNVVPEQSTRLAQLRAGEAGFIDGIAGPARQQLEGQPGIKIYDSPAAAMATLFFQEPEAHPYQDVRIRRALQLATDQEALIKTLLGGAGSRSPAAHLFPVTAGYDPKLFPPQPFDPRRAAALLAEAGVEKELEITVSAYDSSSAPQIPRMAEAVAGMWRDLGVRVEVRTMEAGTYLKEYAAHRLGGMTALASGAWFDGEALLRTDYLNGQPYSPPTPDEISARILSLGNELDEQRRIAGIQDVYKSIVDGAWSVTLPWSNAAWAVRDDRVASWQPLTAWAYPHALETLVARPQRG